MSAVTGTIEVDLEPAVATINELAPELFARAPSEDVAQLPLELFGGAFDRCFYDPFAQHEDVPAYRAGGLVFQRLIELLVDNGFAASRALGGDRRVHDRSPALVGDTTTAGGGQVGVATPALLAGRDA